MNQQGAVLIAKDSKKVAALRPKHAKHSSNASLMKALSSAFPGKGRGIAAERSVTPGCAL